MNKLNSKSIVIIIVIVLIIISMLSLMLMSGLKNNNEEVTTTTTKSTTTKTINKELKEELYGVSVEYSDTKEIEDDHKLEVVKLEEKVSIENVVALYDINLKDINNNIVKVENTSLLITIPYQNVDNYKTFKVLYLNDTNEVLETIPASYLDGKVSFRVTHLSRYAIVGEKDETKTTTTTTKKVVNNTQVTTTVPTTKATTNATTKATTTTKKTTTKKTTTKATTTKKVTTTSTSTTKKTTSKTYTYSWGSEKDAAGQSYLYIIDNNGNKVSGTVTIGYIGSDYSETINVSKDGVLLVKDIVKISNVKVR